MAHRLECRIQEYAWGDVDAIAQLTGRPNDERRPQAELWMGAHPAAPSKVGDVSLDLLVATDPVRWLGRPVASRHGELPFLFKVLAAAQPLSIQAHPSADQAVAGFDREDRAGIALDDFQRIYRDRHHKPELICALTRFEVLCGFRSAAEICADLVARPELDLGDLADALSGDGWEEDRLARALDLVLGLSSERAAAVGAALASSGGVFQVLHDAFPGDVGVVVALLLNHRVLEPGEATFLGAGTLHAYVSGVGVEVLANSDNVIRGGLTAKHIDREELRRVVDTRPLHVEIQAPSGPIHTYDTPVDEFALTRVRLEPGSSLSVSGPAIVLVTEGSLTAQEIGRVETGNPLLVAGTDPTFECCAAVDGNPGGAEIYVASVKGNQVRACRPTSP